MHCSKELTKRLSASALPVKMEYRLHGDSGLERLSRVPMSFPVGIGPELIPISISPACFERTSTIFKPNVSGHEQFCQCLITLCANNVRLGHKASTPSNFLRFSAIPKLQPKTYVIPT